MLIVKGWRAVFKPSQASGSLVANAGLRGPALGCRGVAPNLGFLLWAEWWMVRSGLPGHLLRLLCFGTDFVAEVQGTGERTFSANLCHSLESRFRQELRRPQPFPASREVQQETQDHLNSVGKGPSLGG